MIPGRRSRLFLLPFLAVAFSIGACSYMRTRADAAVCRAVLPAVEPEGEIRLLSLERDAGETVPTVRIRYAVEPADGKVRSGVLRCALREGGLGDKPHLVGIEVNGVRMGDVRLFFLERFWLGDPDAIAAGEKRVVDATGESASVLR